MRCLCDMRLVGMMGVKTGPQDTNRILLEAGTLKRTPVLHHTHLFPVRLPYFCTSQFGNRETTQSG